MTLNLATAQNIKRKSHWADNVQLLEDGTPLFSWLDIDPIDACNRACVFCPRSDPRLFPNQPKNFFSVDLAQKLGDELRSLKYEGAVILCGTGEPLLHPRMEDILRAFNGVRVEIVTNGDRLNERKIRDLYEAGASFINVSMYDGPHQVGKFQEMFKGFHANAYSLRDRWYDESEDYGLKLTNRGGTVHAGHQPEVDLGHICYYPDYCLTLSWDGRVLLCPQDWNMKITFGNAHDATLVDIWKSSALMKRRKQLLRGRKGLNPCDGCNCDGTMHGKNHVDAWGFKDV